MLFAFGPQDLKLLAIPIGIGLAALLILLVPSLRRNMIESFMKGHESGKRFREGKKPEHGQNDVLG